MAKVASPMIVIVTRKVRLRPVRSPNQPNTRAPSGRTAKPAAKVSSAKMKPWVSPAAAKKCLAMIAVREPKMKKSYHSKMVPAAEAASTSPIRGAGAVSSLMISPLRADPARAVNKCEARRNFPEGSVSFR